METACSWSVHDDSSMAVSPEKLRRNGWKELILWALKMIAHRVISVDDSTGDTANNATINVDKVLDKILDNAIEAYGSSARDV